MVGSMCPVYGVFLYIMVGMTAKEALEFAKKNDVKQLDLRFTDLPGVQQHVSYPIGELSESSFEEGFGFDGSSIRGWAAINESDMLLVPDPATAILDPFFEVKTLVMNCNVIDPITRQSYDRDPRWIARKAELYVKNSGLADTAFFGAEAEFFIFDSVSFDQNAHSGFYFIDAEEGRWNSGRRENNLGYRPRYKEGYFPVPPTDQHQDLRAEMVETMGRSASTSSATITKSPPPASARSISASTRSPNRPTT